MTSRSRWGLADLGDLALLTHDKVCGLSVAATTCQLAQEHGGPCVPKLNGVHIPMPEDNYNKIVDGLYQGGGYFTPLRRDFTAVLDHYYMAIPPEEGVEHHKVLYDDADLPAPELLFEAMSWVYSRWEAGGQVLVRCQAGLNRSGMTVALALIRGGASPEDAIDLVRQGRSPYAICNPRFVEYIRGLDV